MRHVLCAALVVSLAHNSAYAYLGGFEPQDGYVDVGVVPPGGISPGGFNVPFYNAGEYDAAANPGGYQQRANGAGLWELLQGPNNPHTAYTTSHHQDAQVMPHSGARALVVTTNTNLWTGNSQIVSYDIESRDLDGVNPAATGSKTVTTSFWVCSEIFGSANPASGLGPNTRGNIISFWDGAGPLAASGLQLGYFQPGTTTDFVSYRLGKTGPWTNTTIPVDPHGWHRWDVTMDFAAQRVSVDLFNPFSPIASHPLIPSTPMSMSALMQLRFESTPGVSNQKYFAIDDFDFEVCITEAPLSELLNGGVLCSGDKKFSDFSYHGGGDMPPAEDIYVKAITDADGNFGIRFQGAFVDAFGGGASDALIDYKVTAPAGKMIKDVHLGANPLVLGGDGAVTVTETFLGTNDNVVLSAYDLEPGGRKLTDWADLVDENGNLKPVQELHVQKDILAWSREAGALPTMSFIDQSFSQIDVLAPAIQCPGDFDLDGEVDGADIVVWREAMASHSAAGDADGDGDSDGGDFLLWQRNLGMTYATSTATSPVPEPTSITLLLATTASLALRRRSIWRSAA